MRRAGLLIAAAAILSLAAVPSWANQRQAGDVIAEFDGGIHPTRLPREAPAPVAVHVSGGIRSASGNTDLLPQLRQIRVAINRQGQLYARGLPVCHVDQIQPATQKAARRICGEALIGNGSVAVQVRIPSQTPFMVRARLLVFNGPQRGGDKLIFAQAYARKPPGAFILTFHVRDGEGTSPTVLSTVLPRQTRRWAYLMHFGMTLHRTYSYRGERHAFVSAACSAPEGFETGLFTFAQATYGFTKAPQIHMSESGTCRVAE